MISYATRNNTPLQGDHLTFVDSGGFHHMMNGTGEYHDTNMEYLEYILNHDPHRFACRDYPCEPELLDKLGRTVKDHQERTLAEHIDMFDAVSGDQLSSKIVSVIQGWNPNQYLSHLDRLRDHGCLGHNVAIGSICRRNQDQEIAEIILRIREALPPNTNLHAFGVKSNVLQYQEIAKALDSADSAAYDYKVSNVPSERFDGKSYTWRDCARAYLNWRYDLLSTIGTKSLTESESTQTTLSKSAQVTPP